LLSRSARQALLLRSGQPQQPGSSQARQQALQQTAAIILTFPYHGKFISLSCTISSDSTPGRVSVLPIMHQLVHSDRICAYSPALTIPCDVGTASFHQLILTLTHRNIHHVGRAHSRAHRQHPGNSHYGRVQGSSRSHGFR
jgi:hypothetical protein